MIQITFKEDYASKQILHKEENPSSKKDPEYVADNTHSGNLPFGSI